ncbi:hypothetical protein Tco_0331223 [Tanacetum coccineum]
MVQVSPLKMPIRNFFGLYLLPGPKVFESDVKGSTASSSSTQNVAFVSSESTSSTNDVSTTYEVSTSSGHNSQREGSSSYTDELTLKKFYKKTGRKLHFDAKEPVGFDKTKVECFNCHNKVTLQRGTTGDAEYRGIQVYTQALKSSKTNVLTYHKKLLAEAVKEKEELKTKLENFQSSSKGLSKLLNSQMSAKDKSRLGYKDLIHEGVLSYENEVLESSFDSRFPLLMTRYLTCPPKYDFGIDESNFTYGLKQSKTSESATNTSDSVSCKSNSSVETLEFVPKPAVNEPMAVTKPKVWFDAPIIEDLSPDSDDDDVIKPSKKRKNLVELNKEKGKGTGQGENKPVWNNVQRLNHQNKFVPKAVLTKTGIFPVNVVRQNLSSQVATTSTARKVNTARPVVNKIRPRNNFYKSHSPIKRPSNRTIAPKVNFANHKVNTVGDKIVSVIGGNRETVV